MSDPTPPPRSHAVEIEAEVAALRAQLGEAEGLLRRVADAVNDAGPRPDWHLKEVRRLRASWPTLWNAVAGIAARNMAESTDNEGSHHE